MSRHHWFHLLGLGLIGVFIAGIISLGIHSWMTWVDLGLGLISIAAALGLAYAAKNGVGIAPGHAIARWSMILCLGLFGTWIAGRFVAGVAAWLSWTTLGFACVYFIFATTSRPRKMFSKAAGVEQQRPPDRPTRVA